MKSYVSSRINKLLSFDAIRKLKILELFQYNFIGFFIVLSISYFLEKLYFSKTYKHFYDKHKSSKNKKLDKSKKSFLILLLVVMIETFFILVIFFYIRKVILLFPPVGIYMNKNFKGLTTFENVVHLTVCYLFLEFIPGYRKKTELILNYEFS